MTQIIFQEILGALMDKKNLTSKTSKKIMGLIINKQLTDAQISALLIAFQNKRITSDELNGFLEALQKVAIHIKPNASYLIDMCGTGGDNSKTFNISTIAAFVVAACDVNVAKHGNRSVSSTCGSADVLEQLGIPINLSPEDVTTCIEETGIGFLFAQMYHPSFKNISHIRKELGVKTLFNMLGPLLNPAPLHGQCIGVFDPSLTELYAETLKKAGMKNAMIIHGDGLDEITICGRTKITYLNRKRIKTFYLEPEEIGLDQCAKKEIQSHSIEENKKIFSDILRGKKSAKRDIVEVNAAAGLIVAGKVDSFKEGIKRAAIAIDTGKALEKFEAFKRLSNDLAKNN